MATMVKVFDAAVVKTSNVQSSVSRESVKELIYQKKNGGHQASKRVISMQRIETTTNFLCQNII